MLRECKGMSVKKMTLRASALIGAMFLVAGGAWGASATESEPSADSTPPTTVEVSDQEAQEMEDHKAELESLSEMQSTSDIESILYAGVAVSVLIDVNSAEIIAAMPVDEEGNQIDVSSLSLEQTELPAVSIVRDGEREVEVSAGTLQPLAGCAGNPARLYRTVAGKSLCVGFPGAGTWSSAYAAVTSLHGGDRLTNWTTSIGLVQTATNASATFGGGTVTVSKVQR